MADTTITGLPNATTPLSGAERVPMDQSGTTKDATTQDIANLAPATDLTYTAATRVLASSTGTDATLPLATTTDAGLQSAADKTKLDGITVDSATVVRKLVRNNSGVAIAKGQPVYQTGSSGTTITVALADASTEATAAQTLGLAQEAIGDNATGWVIAVGELNGVNTATLTEGQIVWLSETTGALTTTRPTQPAHGVVLGYCVKQGAGTSGILYVKVDNGLELNELHDVLISSPTAGQVLRRAADGLWKNAALAAADLTGLGTAAPLDVAAAGDASASQVVKGNDSRLSDSREWSATTIDQAEAEAGSATTRRAFTAQRVRQAIVAWWATVSGTVAASGSIGSSGLTMATARLLGRSAAGTGAIEDIQLGTGLSFSGTTLNAVAAPVQSVAGKTGAVTLVVGDVSGAAASGSIGSSGLTMATARLLGRSTAGTGAVEEIQVTGATLSGGVLTITGGSTNANDLTSGTLADDRLSAKVMAAVNTTLWSNFR